MHGDGTIKIEMNFLPDVYVPCEVCHGARYNRETLEVHYRARPSPRCSTCRSRRAEFFAAVPAISRHLRTLVDVGLGYVRLGQPAPTLSGGEAQRVKLAAELQKRATGRTIYVLDEPTTGLHFEDIRKLLKVLQRLVDTGNTVLVIEHNLDVIKTADWLIDMGPEGGSGGGTVVATGTPEDVALVSDSHRRLPRRHSGSQPHGGFMTEAREQLDAAGPTALPRRVVLAAGALGAAAPPWPPAAGPERAARRRAPPRRTLLRRVLLRRVPPLQAPRSPRPAPRPRCPSAGP